MGYIGCPSCFKTMRDDGSACPHCGSGGAASSPQASASEGPAVPPDVLKALQTVGADDEVVVHAVGCRHGEGESGWLVATNRRIWWFGKLRGVGALLMKKDAVELSYLRAVKVTSSNTVFSNLVALRTGAFNMIGKPATLSLGRDQFQMTTAEAERFAKVVRDARVEIADAEAEQRDGSTRSVATSSPAEDLSKLADLRDRVILSEAEFEAKKAEILSRPW